MQVLCPQHKLPLEIGDTTINTLGTSYPSTIGRCPQCRSLYVNRMIFPACITFQIDGQSYQYSDKLNSAYPPKAALIMKKGTGTKSDKKQIDAELPLTKKERKVAQRKEKLRLKKEKEVKRKQKAREAGIQEMRNRILKGDYSEYHVKNVHFVEKIPEVCKTDGDDLLDVKHISFDMYGVKVKAHARCCIRCNSAYLLEKKQIEIQEKVKALTSKPTSQIKTKSEFKQHRQKPESQTQLKITDTLYQIPVLVDSDRQCPFCKADLDPIVSVNYYAFDITGQSFKKQIYLRGCSYCKSVFANQEQAAFIRRDNHLKTVHMLSPLKYPSAEAMMKAAKSSPQQEMNSIAPLPYEDYLRNKENISRVSNVVQIYANKCHCQRCENKYQRITTVNRTAVVDTIDGSTVDINVMFCKGCGQYFVNIITMEQYKTIYGGLLMECKTSKDFSPSQYAWFDFAPDSILSRCGYTVKEGVSAAHRHAILQYILETGKATKYEIIEKINSFISLRDNQQKYDGACTRWREDIKFVNEYKIHQQKKVRGLDFKPAEHLHVKI